MINERDKWQTDKEVFNKFFFFSSVLFWFVSFSHFLTPPTSSLQTAAWGWKMWLRSFTPGVGWPSTALERWVMRQIFSGQWNACLFFIQLLPFLLVNVVGSFSERTIWYYHRENRNFLRPNTFNIGNVACSRLAIIWNLFIRSEPIESCD